LHFVRGEDEADCRKTMRARGRRTGRPATV